jgi:fructose 1,6-bisphosphatase
LAEILYENRRAVTDAGTIISGCAHPHLVASYISGCADGDLMRACARDESAGLRRFDLYEILDLFELGLSRLRCSGKDIRILRII